MNCCGHPTVTWEEPSILAAPPAWWDDALHGTYDAPVQTSHHTLCLRCGRHTEEITANGD